MKKVSAIKKIRTRASKLNLGVTIDDRDYHGNGRSKVYVQFEGSNQIISFWTNSDGTISSPHSVREGLESDPHTDYFPGTFWDNLTQALNYTVPLPPKYNVGSLVRFKDNKRMQRHKLSGIVALIVEAHTGGTYKLQWDGSEDRYNPTYSERDIEKIS